MVVQFVVLFSDVVRVSQTTSTSSWRETNPRRAGFSGIAQVVSPQQLVQLDLNSVIPSDVPHEQRESQGVKDEPHVRERR